MFFLLPYVVAASALSTIAVRTGKFRRQPRASAPTPGERSLAARLGLIPAVSAKTLNAPARRSGFTAHRGDAEREAFTALKVAGAAVGLSVAGLFFFPLRIVGAACLLPLLAGHFQDAWRSLVHERRVKDSMLVSVFIVAAVLGGFFLSLTMAVSFVVAVRWLALKTEDHSKQGIADLLGNKFGLSGSWPMASKWKCPSSGCKRAT